MKASAAAMAAVLITGTSSIWTRMSTTWKAISLVLAIGAVGFASGGAVATNMNLPGRVSALEIEHTSIRTELATAVSGNEEDRCLLKRVLCRLDGDSANSCDLQYAVRRGSCTD